MDFIFSQNSNIYIYVYVFTVHLIKKCKNCNFVVYFLNSYISLPLIFKILPHRSFPLLFCFFNYIYTFWCLIHFNLSGMQLKTDEHNIKFGTVKVCWFLVRKQSLVKHSLVNVNDDLLSTY